MYVKRNVRTLTDYEYLLVSGKKQRGGRLTYHLLKDEEITLIDLSVIPDPKTMKTKLNEKSGSTGSEWVKSGADPLFEG